MRIKDIAETQERVSIRQINNPPPRRQRQRRPSPGYGRQQSLFTSTPSIGIGDTLFETNEGWTSDLCCFCRHGWITPMRRTESRRTESMIPSQHSCESTDSYQLLLHFAPTPSNEYSNDNHAPELCNSYSHSQQQQQQHYCFFLECLAIPYTTVSCKRMNESSLWY